MFGATIPSLNVADRSSAYLVSSYGCFAKPGEGRDTELGSSYSCSLSRSRGSRSTSSSASTTRSVVTATTAMERRVAPPLAVLSCTALCRDELAWNVFCPGPVALAISGALFDLRTYTRSTIPSARLLAVLVLCGGRSR